MVGKILGKANVEIDIGNDGKEGLDKATAAHKCLYDLVLMDIQVRTHFMEREHILWEENTFYGKKTHSMEREHVIINAYMISCSWISR